MFRPSRYTTYIETCEQKWGSDAACGQSTSRVLSSAGESIWTCSLVAERAYPITAYGLQFLIMRTLQQDQPWDEAFSSFPPNSFPPNSSPLYVGPGRGKPRLRASTSGLRRGRSTAWTGISAATNVLDVRWTFAPIGLWRAATHSIAKYWHCVRPTASLTSEIGSLGNTCSHRPCLKVEFRHDITSLQSEMEHFQGSTNQLPSATN